MTDQTKTFSVGCKVVTTQEYPGFQLMGKTYGHLPIGAKGEVTGHTEDGRAVFHFAGYGIHTFDNPEGIIVTEPPSLTDVTLRRIGYDPVQILERFQLIGALAEVCSENVKLRDFARSAIAALRNAPVSEEIQQVMESAPEVGEE